MITYNLFDTKGKLIEEGVAVIAVPELVPFTETSNRLIEGTFVIKGAQPLPIYTGKKKPNETGRTK